MSKHAWLHSRNEDEVSGPWDPAALSYDGLWLADSTTGYTLVVGTGTMLGVTTLGSSGGRDIVNVGTAPALGSPSGAGHVPPDYSTGNDLTSGLAISNFVTTTEWFAWAYVELDTLFADPGAGSRWNAPGVFCDNLITYFNVTLHDGGVTARVSDGGSPYEITIAGLTTGTKHLVHAKQVGGLIYAGIDGTWTAGSAAAAIGDVSNVLTVGRAYGGSIDGRIWAAGINKPVKDDAELAELLAGLTARYADAADWAATDVADCILWYRASNATDDGGGLASAWNDQSGIGDSNRNLVQATGGSRPTISASNANFNGRTTLSMSAKTMVTGTFAAPTAQPFTIYTVFRYSVSGNRFIYDDIDGTNRVALLDDAATPASPYIFAGNSVDGSGGDMPVDVTHVVCAVFNGASSAAYVSRYSTAAVTGDAGANTLTSLRIGDKFDLSSPFAGDIAEIDAYSGAHDATARQTVMEALGGLYGVSITA